MKITTRHENHAIGIGEYVTLRTLEVRELAAPEGGSVDVTVMKGERITLWVGNEFAEFTLEEWGRFLRRVSASRLREMVRNDKDVTYEPEVPDAKTE